MKRLSILATGLLALPFLLACEDGPTAPASLKKAPADPPPAGTWMSLEIVPETFSLKVGGERQVDVVIKTAEGEIASGRDLVTWSSSKPGVARVVGHGRVRGLASGDAEILASYQGKRARAFVNVIALPGDDDEDLPDDDGKIREEDERD